MNVDNSVGMKPQQKVRKWLIGGLVASNLLTFGLSIDALRLSRTHYEQRAEVATQNVASAVDQSVSGSIERVDLALRVTVDELEQQLAAGGIDDAAMTAFLTRQMERLPEVEAFRVAQADGLVILGKGVRKQDRVSWADRDYFMFLKDHPEGGLQISKPRVGRVAQKYIVGLARRYNYPDGRFAGVVSAPIPLEHFTQLLSQFNLGRRGTLNLRYADQGLVTRVPAILDRPAGQIGNNTVSAELRQIFESGVPASTYYTAASADGFERISTFRRLSNAPMAVLVGVAKEDYLADWYREINHLLLIASGFLIVSVLLGGFLLRLLRQAETREIELARYRDHLEELVKDRTVSLSVAKEAAEAANRAKTIFLATMSHELRTPINGIMGMTELALRRATNPKQAEQLEKVTRASEKLLAIINNILDYSKMGAERIDLEIVSFRVADAISEQIGHKARQAGEKGIRLSEEVAPDLAGLTLRGDLGLLGHVLSHLIDNAIKFTTDGTVTIRADLAEKQPADVLVRFEIQDNGIGIPSEHQQRLFSAFEQINGSMSRKHGGIGLGLALCKRLVTAMGGSIGVISQEGRGSTFWFTVRLEKTEPSEAVCAAGL